MRLRWSAVEGTLRGPFRPAAAAEEEAFEVAGGGSAGLCFGWLSPGPGWPAGLERLERFAAAPVAGPGGSLVAGDAVLWFAEPGREPRALCARTPAGDSVWSVDPRAWIRALLAEEYVEGWSRPLPTRVPFFNYARTPFFVKRAFARLQDPAREGPPPRLPFPELPFDDLADRLRRLCAWLAWGSAEADRELWPNGARAALTLTHDVDTGWILEPARAALLARILDAEIRHGFQGAWYVVADRLDPSRHAPALERIRAAGHELGAHGWNHDGRLQYLDPEQQAARMAKIRQRFAGVEPLGMRTPWYARSPGLFDAMAGRFAYDSSVPNASAFYSRWTRSGCCTLLPWAPRPGLVEIPMTLPPDTAVPADRRRAVLASIAERIVERGGVVVSTLHPQPHQSANEVGLEAYFGLLRDLRERLGGSLWCATPFEIAERCRRWL